MTVELNWRTVTGGVFWPDVGDVVVYEQYVGAYTIVRIGVVKQGTSGLLVQSKYKQKGACDNMTITPGFRWAPWKKAQ